MATPRRRRKNQSRWSRLRALLQSLGTRGTIQYLLRKKGIGARRDLCLRPKEVAYPLNIRGDSSDFAVFHQVFVRREYGGLDDLRDVGLVIDCGANVGYSSALFLSKFPLCRVVAVEPDPGNFAALQRNLAPYGARARLLEAGVWSSPARLSISSEKYRDGREWARQVRLSDPGEAGDIEGIDVGSILADSGFDRISLLKMDVEGAEAVVFAENFEGWLDKVDAMAIELHDDTVFGKAKEVFRRAIDGHGFHLARSGELTLCRRQPTSD